ncbi:MAG: hypothetical protein HZC12_01190 [Nitrospirae bacterium]|nr:hypothetical protein [Nitrospirota bacterium]
MPQLNIKIKDREIISLVEQLPKKKKQVLLKKLIIEDMPGLKEISDIGRRRFIAFCKSKGIDLTLLSEEDKEKLIDKVLHEAN